MKNTMVNSLNSISPIDGRYRNQIEKLSRYFSEKALIYYRLVVEVEYFISLVEIPLPQLKTFPLEKIKYLKKIYEKFTDEDALEVKKIEKKTNHDVKAIEYFLKNKFDLIGVSKFKEFIHFGLTSQDINNTSIPLSIKNAIKEEYLPNLNKVLSNLNKLSSKSKTISMLARTHGQPASPTKLGKEIMVFIERLKNQIQVLNSIPNAAKFGGATGNYNAHLVSYPKINWKKFSSIFLETKFGLRHSFPTTQIEHYDYFSSQCDSLRRINNILIDMCRDIWLYISMDYFKQKIVINEVGSSAMPHKINPIDFENAEGNLGIANSTFIYLSQKLPISRLQRDLTDSTTLRNVGVPFAHTIIAFKSLNKGLSKLLINRDKISKDLEENWSVVAEGIQTILRREGYLGAYEKLKDLTRKNKKINQTIIYEFIDSLDITSKAKNDLKKITPFNYVGI
ncbi:MAG: adenylosuccinate lyase [Flavobacteriaceae bacterium]|tara:strand:- start:4039 stop:5391 length:1353 start_codon:yes stop_codon:yes gene_type:complete